MKGSQPGSHTSRERLRWSCLWGEGGEFGESSGHLGQGGIGVGGGIGRRLQTQGVGGFADQLTNRDGVEMQIAEKAMVIVDGGDGQLGAQGHQLPDLLKGRGWRSGGRVAQGVGVGLCSGLCVFGLMIRKVGRLAFLEGCEIGAEIGSLLTGVGDEAQGLAQRQGAMEAALKKRIEMNVSTESEDCADRLQQARQGGSATVKGDTANGAGLGGQTAQNVARAHFQPEIHLRRGLGNGGQKLYGLGDLRQQQGLEIRVCRQGLACHGGDHRGTQRGKGQCLQVVPQWRHHRSDQRGMEGLANRQQGGLQPLLAGPLHHLLHAGAIAGDHGLPRGVNPRHAHPLLGRLRRAEGLHCGRIRFNAGHGAGSGAMGVHQLAALAGQRQQGGFIKGASPVQGRQLAQAVADGDRGFDLELPHDPQAHQGGGDDGGLGELGGAGVVVIGEGKGRIEAGEPRETAPPEPRIAIHRCGLAWKEKAKARRLQLSVHHHGALAQRLIGKLEMLQQALQGGDGRGHAVGDNGGAHGMGWIDLCGQGGGEIPEFSPGELSDPRQQLHEESFQGVAGFGAEEKQFGVLVAGGEDLFAGGEDAAAELGGIFEGEMGVDATESHGTHAGAQRQRLRPHHRLGEHGQGGLLALEVIVGHAAGAGGGQHLAVEGEGGLDQASHASGGLGVADVGFDGTNRHGLQGGGGAVAAAL